MYLAAVAVGSSILSFLYWGFGFLRMGTTGLAAQTKGAGNYATNKLIIGQSMVLGATIALLVVASSPVMLTISSNANYQIAIRHSRVPSHMVFYSELGQSRTVACAVIV